MDLELEEMLDYFQRSKYVFHAHLKRWSKKQFSDYLELLNDARVNVLCIDKEKLFFRIETDGHIIQVNFFEQEDFFFGKELIEVTAIVDVISLRRVS